MPQKLNRTFTKFSTVNKIETVLKCIPVTSGYWQKPGDRIVKIWEQIKFWIIIIIIIIIILRLLWLKVNKSVYIANRTYQFCWQYAILLAWKAWLSALNQLYCQMWNPEISYIYYCNMNNVKIRWPYYLLVIKMIDWN